jgi:hypothetical protein
MGKVKVKIAIVVPTILVNLELGGSEVFPDGLLGSIKMIMLSELNKCLG